jgi:hypothetical protein
MHGCFHIDFLIRQSFHIYPKDGKYENYRLAVYENLCENSHALTDT